MWTTLLKALFDSLAPQFKPVLDVLVKKAVEQFLKNLSGNATTGTMAVSAGFTQEQVDEAVAKTVDDLMAS
jgi:hypothetical protein